MKAHHMTLPIYNLGCGGEASVVERTLTHVPGVTHVYVNPATEMAYVEYDPALADSTQLFAALEREGFGQPISRPDRPIVAQRARKHLLDTRRMALTGGIVLVGLYTLCVLADLFFPNFVQMYRVWELVLIGFDWTDRGTLPLGFVEAFFYGAIGAGAFAALYNALPERNADGGATTRCGAHARGGNGTSNTKA